jgi:hypothetical protein
MRGQLAFLYIWIPRLVKTRHDVSFGSREHDRKHYIRQGKGQGIKVPPSRGLIERGQLARLTCPHTTEATEGRALTFFFSCESSSSADIQVTPRTYPAYRRNTSHCWTPISLINSWQRLRDRKRTQYAPPLAAKPKDASSESLDRHPTNHCGMRCDRPPGQFRRRLALFRRQFPNTRPNTQSRQTRSPLYVHRILSSALNRPR